MIERIVARWKSRGGKYFVELYHTQQGYSYRGTDCGGYLGKDHSDYSATTDILNRLHIFFPDNQKNIIREI